MAKSAKIVEIQMQLALDACRNVIDPNFSDIARQFPPVNRQTLHRRFIGTQGSRASANSIHRQNLTNEQEDELIKLINSLTLRGLPPTSAIVRNLAEEMTCRPVGKNWTGQFVQRHKDKLQSIYLRNIDNMRTQSEYAPIIQHFFDLVLLFLYCIIVF
jgi:Tc5 transposase DNA-binding domain